MRVKTKVSMEEAKRRAVAYMEPRKWTGGPSYPRRRLFRASEVGAAIWPDSELRAQGLGGAASRVLSELRRAGVVSWTLRDGDWGYEFIGGKCAGMGNND